MFINFGTIQALTDAEQITLDMYEEIEAILYTYISKATKLDEYGMTEKADVLFEYGNKIVYLVSLLFIIRERILKDYRNCELQTFDTYKEEYKLDCIRKTFSCFSIPFDVNPLYAVFGLDNPYGFDGIAFMALEIDDTIACNINTVFEVQ